MAAGYSRHDGIKLSLLSELCARYKLGNECSQCTYFKSKRLVGFDTKLLSREPL